LHITFVKHTLTITSHEVDGTISFLLAMIKSLAKPFPSGIWECPTPN